MAGWEVSRIGAGADGAATRVWEEDGVASAFSSLSAWILKRSFDGASGAEDVVRRVAAPMPWKVEVEACPETAAASQRMPIR